MNSKTILCQVHNGEHNATLYVWPDNNAGYFTCPEDDETYEHEHEEIETRELTIDSYDHNEPYGHSQQEFDVRVCCGEDGCGVIVE